MKTTTVSKMWVYCNGKINDRSIIIFEYKPTRGGENPLQQKQWISVIESITKKTYWQNCWQKKDTNSVR